MFTKEFIYQIVSLILAIIVVHAVYLVGIRPQANSFLEEQAATVLAGEAGDSLERPLRVLIKDYEQESCFILLFWAIAIMAYKFRAVGSERAMLSKGLLSSTQGMRILPDDTRDTSRQIESLSNAEKETLLSRTLLAGLSRFRATKDVQNASTTIGDLCDGESERLDSELSMIRYIAWAIPSIGFIGTVRGIGEALGKAHKAVEGDITQVTQSLGVAFNSTLIALFISIVLMFIIHQLQLMQERYVMEVERYCDDALISNLSAGDQG